MRGWAPDHDDTDQAATVLAIDVNAHKIKRAGEAIPFTPLQVELCRGRYRGSRALHRPDVAILAHSL